MSPKNMFKIHIENIKRIIRKRLQKRQEQNYVLYKLFKKIGKFLIKYKMRHEECKILQWQQFR